MVRPHLLTAVAAFCHVANAQCPYMSGDAPNPHVRRQDAASSAQSTDEFMKQYEIDDKDSYITSPVGSAFSDQESLSAGERGPTLLEDFIFRQSKFFQPSTDFC